MNFNLQTFGINRVSGAIALGLLLLATACDRGGSDNDKNGGSNGGSNNGTSGTVNSTNGQNNAGTVVRTYREVTVSRTDSSGDLGVGEGVVRSNSFCELHSQLSSLFEKHKEASASAVEYKWSETDSGIALGALIHKNSRLTSAPAALAALLNDVFIDAGKVVTFADCETSKVRMAALLSSSN
jgi:hypothetical protein